MSKYIKNGVFNHQKWQRKINEGPGNDPLLKSLRTRIPGEKFPELNVWWEYEPEDIMTYVYWHQGQLPPTGPKFDKEWTNIVKQLHSKHPIPSDVLPHVDLDRQSMDAIMHDVPRAENIDNATMTEATPYSPGDYKLGKTFSAHDKKGFKPGDMWSEDFDYTGMLETGANTYLSDGLNVMHDLHASFTDVNYHTEAKDLGNAIEWYEDRRGSEDEEKAMEFMEMFREACAKTLSAINRK